MFHVVTNMAAPAIFGTRFINQHVEAIYPRLNKVYCAALTIRASACMAVLSATKCDSEPMR